MSRGRKPPPTWAQRLRGVRPGQLPLTMLIASVLSGLGIVQVSFLLVQEGYRSLSWSAQAREERRQVAQLKQDIAVLKSVQDHQNDPAFLSELARCQGFVVKGERVVVDTQAQAPEAGNCDIVPLP